MRGKDVGGGIRKRGGYLWRHGLQDQVNFLQGEYGIVKGGINILGGEVCATLAHVMEFYRLFFLFLKRMLVSLMMEQMLRRIPDQC